MVNSLYYPQWRNENAQRAYPFEETSSLVDQSGQLGLLPDWLVDASLAPLTGKAPFSLGQLILDGENLTLTIQDSSRLIVGTGTARRNSSDPIAIHNADGHLIGTLVVGAGANYPLYMMGDGIYDFGSGYADFVLDTVFDLSNLTGFFGFELAGQTYNGGDLVFVGEGGVQLAVEDTLEQKNDGQLAVKRMRIHAVGDPQFLSRDCNDDSQRPTRFVREIVFQYGKFTHVCKPNSLGNILLLADSPSTDAPALQVLNSPQGIIIHLAGKGL